MNNPSTALVLGSTGLIGSYVLSKLLVDPQWQSVTAITRRALNHDHPRLNNPVMPLDEMGQHKSLFAVDAVFCCLGTTMGQAGSKEAFRQVDLEYPLLAAQLALSMGVKHFLVVSAVNADVRGLSFYARTKGEMEQQLESLGFEHLTIARPSLLTGERQDFRFGEVMGNKALALVKPLFAAAKPRWMPIAGEQVAAALVSVARNPGQPGTRRLYYRDFVAVEPAVID